MDTRADKQLYDEARYHSTAEQNATSNDLMGRFDSLRVSDLNPWLGVGDVLIDDDDPH